MFVAQLLSVVNLRSNQRSKYNTIVPAQLLQIMVIKTKLFKEVITWRGEHKKKLLHSCPSTLSVPSVIRSHKVSGWLSQPSCLTVNILKSSDVRRREIKDRFTIKDCMCMYMYISSSYRKAKSIFFQWIIARKEGHKDSSKTWSLAQAKAGLQSQHDKITSCLNTLW